jgi:predicted amidophosphoribosyltransferase
MDKTYCEGCHYELREDENQYCRDCAEGLAEFIAAQERRWQQERAARVPQFRDYEPELAYGTAHDFQNHTRFGGTRDDY